MFWNNKVVWSEGMFLQPEHFQQHDRFVEKLIEGRTGPVSSHAWGHVVLELDSAALALGKIQLAAGRGILPDGTPFDFPGNDAPPTPLDIPANTKDELIVLALPLRRPGTSDTEFDTTDSGRLARYLAAETDVDDANHGSDRSARLQVGQMRLRLLRGSDAGDAYSVLGVVRVLERRPDNQVVLDRAYIPPMLHAGADAVLAGYSRDLHGMLHQRAETLAARVGQPGKGGVAEIADFLFLQTVNRYEALFAHLAAHPLLHPERLYSWLLMLAGDLAVFGRADRRAAAFGPYQHDALERCFAPVVDDIRRSLSVVLERHAIPITLVDKKYGVRVGVIPEAGLLKDSNFVLAANAQIAADVLRVRFPAQVKIGPVERIRDLVNLQLPGIGLRALPVAPRQIPFHAGFNYFELDRGGELWQQLEHSGGLAVFIPATEFPGLETELWAIRE